MLKRRTDTVPKIDQVAYLFESLGFVRDQFTFDAIRQELIRLRPEWRENRRVVSPTTFWSNARDVLRELMRLGLVNRSPLTSRPGQLDRLLARTFVLYTK